MIKSDTLPMWRKILIAICSIVVIVCLILVGIIKDIITHEESDNQRITVVYEKNPFLKPLLELNEINESEYKHFMQENKDKLSKFRRLSDHIRASHILYNNQKFINTFGKDLFDSMNDGSEEAYDNRCELFRKKVVTDAFINLYSPFTKDGRDNRKGLGAKWEEYDQMSIPAKEDFIRSNFEKKYEEIYEKENNKRVLWGRILLTIVLLLGISIFLLIVKPYNNNNLHARKSSLYCIICFAINYIIHQVLVLLHPDYLEIEGWVIVFFLSSVFVLSAMEVYLANKSQKKYYNYYLIPEKFPNKLKNTDYRKRLLMLFLIYPLFYLVPIPILGTFVLLLYIIPVLLILGIIYVVTWLREGKGSRLAPYNYNKARLYCRHCGKLIDADSDYCRYCGKKL